jgi:hypothetical protein
MGRRHGIQHILQLRSVLQILGHLESILNLAVEEDDPLLLSRSCSRKEEEQECQ